MASTKENRATYYLPLNKTVGKKGQYRNHKNEHIDKISGTGRYPGHGRAGAVFRQLLQDERIDRPAVKSNSSFSCTLCLWFG